MIFFVNIKCEKPELEFSEYGIFGLQLSGDPSECSGGQASCDFLSTSIPSHPSLSIFRKLGQLAREANIGCYSSVKQIVLQCFPEWKDYFEDYHFEITFPAGWKKIVEKWPEFFSKYDNLQTDGNNLIELFTRFAEYYSYIDEMYIQCLYAIKRYFESNEVKNAKEYLLIVSKELERMES